MTKKKAPKRAVNFVRLSSYLNKDTIAKVKDYALNPKLLDPVKINAFR